MKLTDQHNRSINYLRLAVTDRCNLRCFYCMPEEGIQFSCKSKILTYEEMIRLIGILNPIGIDKIRITGGEPFVRKDLIFFLQEIKKQFDLKNLSITTNATLLHRYLNELPTLFNSMNISLDSLDKQRFFEITRRDSFDIVYQNIQHLLALKMEVKINAVIMEHKNIADIIPFVAWTQHQNINVRFIEEMPFNGSGNTPENCVWNYQKILAHIKTQFPNIINLPSEKSGTSLNYKVKGFKGSFGIIPAFSRTFCGTCNRIRLTAKGEMRTCLYSEKGIDLLALLRNGSTDEQIKRVIINGVLNKEKDGFEAASQRDKNSSIYESMTSIGG